MFIYAIIKTDDTIDILSVESMNYDTISAAVGGWIEGVPLEGVTAYVNEEGKINGLPTNKIATLLAHQSNAIFPNDYIVGNMIVMGPIDDEGEETSLDLHWVQRVSNEIGMQV